MTPCDPATSHLSVINLNGQELIYRHITEALTVIDISNLPSGVYFVRLIGDKSVAVSKIVKN